MSFHKLNYPSCAFIRVNLHKMHKARLNQILGCSVIFLLSCFIRVSFSHLILVILNYPGSHMVIVDSRLQFFI